MNTPTGRVIVSAAALSIALAATGCSTAPTPDGSGELAGASLIVGSKEFTEQLVLGQITALALENAGATITDETGLTGSATVREALVRGELDIYWDYTGTGWVNILGNTPSDLPDDLYGAVSEADAKNGIAWLEPANFENTYRIATSEQFASEHGIETMSDVAAYVKAHPTDGKVCAASEFIARDDGLPGVEHAYDFAFSEIVELDFNLIYTQIGDTCSFGEVFSTDARIPANSLRVITDDLGFFVEYLGAVTLRQETLDTYPAIADIFAPIAEALTIPTITALNGKVDIEGEDPRDVAEEWLLAEGFIG
ncbi:glycine betaine ABC transporter substrate-binding protein [Leucobacter sp. NPDC015123]|uniref:glycine betaine ABC transporter substrate-binding protein n=1 Tax=Leucobacter sp. NPDC015123 TaxID=3364129 RepID=UPI0036F48970